MNLSTISRLPDDLPGTLGAPIRREPEKPADPGRWVPASEPGYLRHTKSGAVSHEQFVPASERPTKPVPVCLAPAEQINAQPADSGEVPSVHDFLRAVDAARGRGTTTQEIKSLMAAKFGAPRFSLIHADRRAEVIAALNALGG